MTIASEFSTNPTKHGVCDGSITFTGLRPDQRATVDYDFNGVPHAPFSATVSRDKSITMPDLCAGAYTHITISVNNCTANGSDITLTEPAVAPLAPMDTNILSNPIYFEVNKTVVHVNSYPTLKYAARKLNEDKDAYIVVNGYTDNSGVPAKNMVLSLKRAEAVKAELVGMGVDPSKIRVIGNGPSDPIGDNKTAQGKALNRRAVMRLDVSGMEMKVKMDKK
jgi:outer membrane protein OmpA-like peptidoglycan-associated protein